MSVEDILKKYNVYSLDLEIELLRHFDDLRKDILLETSNTTTRQVFGTDCRSEK